MSPSPYLPLLLGVLCVSAGAILVRLAEAPALAVAFYRVFFASLLIAPFGFPGARRSWPVMSARHRALLLLSGLALALHFATWIASLSLTSIASSTLLVNTAPVFALAFARIFLRESVSGAVAFAIALALVGAAIIALGDWGDSPASLAGNLLALAGAVTGAAYYVVGRGLRDALPLNAYVLMVWASSALALLVIALAFGATLGPYPRSTFLAVFGLGLIPTVGGHGLVNRALRELPAPTVGLFLLGEPVGASILGFFVLGEVPGTWSLVGGSIVLAALGLVLARSQRPAA